MGVYLISFGSEILCLKVESCVRCIIESASLEKGFGVSNEPPDATVAYMYYFITGT